MAPDVNEENYIEEYEEYLKECGKTTPYYDPKFSFYLQRQTRNLILAMSFEFTLIKLIQNERVQQTSDAELNSMMGKLNHQQWLFAYQI